MHMQKKTLTIVLCQTRESKSTYDSLVSNVLVPLESDLAFCGSYNQGDDRALDLIIANSKYIWNIPEPENWVTACDAISTDGGRWKELSQISPMFLGGAGLEGTVGSGLIIFYYRALLNKCLTPTIIESYDWFVITRSDFLWKVSHPGVSLLDSERIYILDGEKYGGISDRHMIFSKKYAKQILSLAEPIFSAAFELTDKLIPHSEDLNPEKYISLSLAEKNLDRHLSYFPYLGYTIRHVDTSTRWSQGIWNENFGYFIKYPEEYIQTNESQFYLRSQDDWKKYIQGTGYLRHYVHKMRVLKQSLKSRGFNKVILVKKWLKSLVGLKVSNPHG